MVWKALLKKKIAIVLITPKTTEVTTSTSLPVYSASIYLFFFLLQVKVMVRVCPASRSDASESSSFLKVDPRKKQVTIMEPTANQAPSSSSQKKSTANQVPPKMFTFDAAFPPDASQVNKKNK